MVFIFIRLAFLMPMVGADTLQADGDAKIGSTFQSQSHASPRIKDRRPCTCEAMNSKWLRPARTNPKCVFIDLGAAGGNSFNSFLNEEYGPVANCINNGDWEAFLVEANPVFNDLLSELEWLYPGKVHSLGGTAAYMCKGETTFFVDNDPTHNYLGSNMEGGAHDGSDWQHPSHMRNQTVVNKGANVTVPFVNVAQLIYEYTIPGDHVIVKMDVEGAEWDILPCLSRSQAVGSLDSLYMEVHPASWQLGNTTPAELEAAQSTLVQQGVAIQSPSHGSPRIEDRRPCNCEAMNSKWSPPARTNAKCVFIDLGAAGGNSFNSFLNEEYGPVADCINNGDWEAFLVEANPVFNDLLSELEWLYPGKVHSLGGKAAYMCKGETTFFVDNDPTHDYWGSNMEGGVHDGADWQHPDHMRNPTGVNKGTNVTVPFVNVPQLIYENTIPADHVIVKMDIEGAEWDILPCLSRSDAVGSLDSLYMEVHPASWQLGNTTPAELRAAQSTLIQKGVAIPVYYSPTL